MANAQRSLEVIRDRFQRVVPRLILLYSQVARDAEVPDVALLALHVLTLHDRPVYPSELSDETGLPRSTVTRVLDTLEQAGYIDRTRAPEDGRRSLVAVRPERVAAISARFDLYGEAMSEAARQFTSGELATVARYWDVLSQAVQVRRDEGHGV